MGKEHQCNAFICIWLIHSQFCRVVWLIWTDSREHGKIPTKTYIEHGKLPTKTYFKNTKGEHLHCQSDDTAKLTMNESYTYECVALVLFPHKKEKKVLHAHHHCQYTVNLALFLEKNTQTLSLSLSSSLFSEWLFFSIFWKRWFMLIVNDLHGTLGFVFETHTHKLSLSRSHPLSSLTKILFLWPTFFWFKKKDGSCSSSLPVTRRIWLRFWRLRKLCRFWIVGVSTSLITYLFFTRAGLFYIRGLYVCIKETFKRVSFFSE